MSRTTRRIQSAPRGEFTDSGCARQVSLPAPHYGKWTLRAVASPIEFHGLGLLRGSVRPITGRPETLSRPCERGELANTSGPR